MSHQNHGQEVKLLKSWNSNSFPNMQQPPLRTGESHSKLLETCLARDLRQKIEPSLQRTSHTVVRPEIEWYPNYETYQARVKSLAANTAAKTRPRKVPGDFPRSIKSARAWTGSDFDSSNDYVLCLSAQDVAELKTALITFKNLHRDPNPDEVNSLTFPLPYLSSKLAIVADNIHRGTGFNIIRGLNPDEFNPLDNLIIYLGITSHVAEQRGCQDYDGRVVVHIRDMQQSFPNSARRRSPYTNKAQPFHTDMCDILSMYAIDTAVDGGESLLASSATIYNEIAATRPDMIHTLAEDNWVHDEFNTIRPSWFTRPLLYNFKDHGPSFCFSRRPLTGAPFSPHPPTVPAMTELQAEALDAVHFAAVKHQLSIKLQRGDIEIINNLALLHARNSFTDVAAQGTRHMLRLWLRSTNPNLAWERPTHLHKDAYNIYESSPAGKVGEFGQVRTWDIEGPPIVDKEVPKHMQCS